VKFSVKENLKKIKDMNLNSFQYKNNWMVYLLKTRDAQQ